MPDLVASALFKSYALGRRRVEVLRGVEFRLEQGEAVAVVGPSGAGKSTLLNLLGALDRADAGSIRLGDQVLDQARRTVTSWRRDVVGFVFQYHFLLPDFSALENLLLPVRLVRDPSAADLQRAHDLLAAMELEQRTDHRPGELSGGEQQRVAVARAFMSRPRVILADEPFGNLDQQKGRRLSDLLFALRDREGTSLVIVTHDQDLARRADRVLTLDQGILRPH